MLETVAIYSRVSTTDQDASRQLDELRKFIAREYPDTDPEEIKTTAKSTGA